MDKKAEVKTVAVVEQPLKQPEPNPDNSIGIVVVIGIAIIIGGIFIYKKYTKGK
tara:strand:+ start:57 stop:218 length:162 start_codon:yes stop_codon:yes gene_type:complete